ncbi:MAG: hypothetical protein GY913_10710 [Proteobacteria bacterium]|nr:hypothetical protein [Pseudomonadota bacterium]MCP4917384.1 hypothetical protein [Pseudomonadota bacterium]
MDPALLPSKAELFRASLVALGVTVVLVVIAVLPAEYAVDPTGLGRKLGLLHLGELKKSAELGRHPLVERESVFQEQVVTLTLAAGRGTEVKALMREDDQLMYRWTASGPVYFDLHAEPAGELRDVFESFETGTLSEAEGVYTPTFEGSHGWYWKNEGAEPITLELRVTGTFARVERR